LGVAHSGIFSHEVLTHREQPERREDTVADLLAVHAHRILYRPSNLIVSV
jgi:hypothetical protein